MPKIQQSVSSRLQSYVSVFEDVFSSDGCVLLSKICEIKNESEGRFNVVQHPKTDKHNRA